MTHCDRESLVVPILGLYMELLSRQEKRLREGKEPDSVTKFFIYIAKTLLQVDPMRTKMELPLRLCLLHNTKF